MFVWTVIFVSFEVDVLRAGTSTIAHVVLQTFICENCPMGSGIGWGHWKLRHVDTRQSTMHWKAIAGSVLNAYACCRGSVETAFLLRKDINGERKHTVQKGWRNAEMSARTVRQPPQIVVQYAKQCCWSVQGNLSPLSGLQPNVHSLEKHRPTVSTSGTPVPQEHWKPWPRSYNSTFFTSRHIGDT